MTYRYGNVNLEIVREVLTGEVNNVYIVHTTDTPQELFYTMLLVKDHTVAKRCLKVLEKNSDGSALEKKGFVSFFTSGTDTCILFDYVEERRLDVFFGATDNKVYDREVVAINLVMECISTSLPYPLLYLILNDDNIHLSKEKSVYLSYYMDLSELDEDIEEADCVRRCAGIILKILQTGEKKQVQSLELIRKKLGRSSYSSFPELYKDIRLAAVPENGRSIIRRIYEFYVRNRDRLFKILLTICIILVAVALIVLISQIFLDDIPFFRLFKNAFKYIGTEYLVR